MNNINELITHFFEDLDKGYCDPANLTENRFFRPLMDLYEFIDLRPSELIMVAGTPMSGKTSFLLSMLVNNCVITKTKSYYITTKHSEKSIITKIMSQNSRINLSTLREYKIEEEHWSRLTNAMSLLYDLEIYISQEDNIDTIISNLKRNITTPNCVIMIDSLSDLLINNQNHSLYSLLNIFKNLAIELEALIFVSTNVNTFLTPNNKLYPPLSKVFRVDDISKVTSQTDTILFVHRDELSTWDSDKKGIMEVHVRYNNSGKLGKTLSYFIDQYSLVENLNQTADIYD